jgi:hypothetical protein
MLSLAFAFLILAAWFAYVRYVLGIKRIEIVAVSDTDKALARDSSSSSRVATEDQPGWEASGDPIRRRSFEPDHPHFN